MPLVLANTASVAADLHKTDAKSSTLLHLPPERQWLDSWGCFDHCFPHSSLLIIFTMFAEGCLHLFISSSAVYHSGKRMVPGAGTVSHNVLPRRDSAPVLVPPATADMGTATIATVSPWWPLLDTFPSISITLRNTVDLYKSLHGRGEWLVQLVFRALQKFTLLTSPSQLILPLAALYAGKQIALMTLQMATLSLLLSEAKSTRASGGKGCVRCKPGKTTLFIQSVFQEATELLKLLLWVPPSAHQTGLLSLRLTFRNIPLYIPSPKLTFLLVIQNMTSFLLWLNRCIITLSHSEQPQLQLSQQPIFRPLSYIRFKATNWEKNLGQIST